MALCDMSPDPCRGDERLHSAAAAAAAASVCWPGDGSSFFPGFHGPNEPTSSNALRREGDGHSSSRQSSLKLETLRPFADTLLQLEPEPSVQVRQ